MARPDRRARQAAEKGGRRAETLAALYLRCKGYRVLARNVRTPAGEVDLVVRRGRTVVFVEVKQRTGRAEAGVAVARGQQQRIARAAEYLSGSPRFSSLGDSFRIDLLLLRPGRWPEHLTDAWRS